MLSDVSIGKLATMRRRERLSGAAPEEQMWRARGGKDGGHDNGRTYGFQVERSGSICLPIFLRNG